MQNRLRYKDTTVTQPTHRMLVCLHGSTTSSMCHWNVHMGKDVSKPQHPQ
jgi:hypothetical protein